MKLKWLMIVSLGAALTGCSGMDELEEPGADNKEMETVTAEAGENPGLCPVTMIDFRTYPLGHQHRCECDSSQIQGSAVFGTDLYSDDSRPCKAAVHAGVITLAGGQIVVRVEPGSSSYYGSYRNGIQSYSWFRPMPRSFSVKALVPDQCHHMCCGQCVAAGVECPDVQCPQ